MRPSEITPRSAYLSRRKILAGAGALASAWQTFGATKLEGLVKSPYSTSEPITPMNDVTHYNNFYEFGTKKNQPAELAKYLRTRPWTLTVEGAVGKSRTYDIDQLLKLAPLEERIYRHRCVEGWSIVVPWIGFPLSALLKLCRAALEGEVRRLPKLLRREARCRRGSTPASRCPTSKGCGWTKPCTP